MSKPKISKPRFKDFLDSSMHKYTTDELLNSRLYLSGDKEYLMFGTQRSFFNSHGITKIPQDLELKYRKPIVLNAESSRSIIFCLQDREESIVQNDLEGIVKPQSGIGNLFKDTPSIRIDNKEYVMPGSEYDTAKILGVSQPTVHNILEMFPDVIYIGTSRLIPKEDARVLYERYNNSHWSKKHMSSKDFIRHLEPDKKYTISDIMEITGLNIGAARSHVKSLYDLRFLQKEKVIVEKKHMQNEWVLPHKKKLLVDYMILDSKW